MIILELSNLVQYKVKKHQPYTTMILIDTNGKIGETPITHDNSSLKEKLKSVIPIAAKTWGLDLSSPVYVWLNENEEHYFLKSFQENHWVPLSEGEEFSAETQNLIPALKAISDEVNNNHTNGYSRFVPLRARRFKTEPTRIKTLYGWYYLAIPEEIKIDEYTKIQIIFT
jgi:hypothetical protein